MKKLMLILMVILFIGCDSHNQAPELYYFNVKGKVVKIQEQVLKNMGDIRVGDSYDFNMPTKVYYIQLLNDTTLYTQLHKYNWYCNESNLLLRKLGDTVSFDYIKRDRFYKN